MSGAIIFQLLNLLDIVPHNGQNVTRLSSSSPSSSISQDGANVLPAHHENYSKINCWLNEEFKIIVPCSKCSRKDLAILYFVERRMILPTNIFNK
jgi:hypothetical protein